MVIRCETGTLQKHCERELNDLIQKLYEASEEEWQLSLCPSCNCMTTAICGKCKEEKT